MPIPWNEDEPRDAAVLVRNLAQALFVRLKPRPEGSLYAGAAASSMRGDHMAMVAVFADMLDRHLSAPGLN